MSDLGRVRRNVVAKFAGEACVRGLGALTFFCLARLMGAEGFGSYVAALAYAGVFVVFHEAGLHFLLAREVARKHSAAGAHVRQVAVLKAVAALAVMAAAPAAAWLAGMPSGMVGLVALAALALNAASFVEMLGAALTGLERMDAEAVIRGAHKTAQFLLPIGAWLLARRAGWVLGAQAAASVLAAVVAFRWAARGGIVAADRRSTRGILRGAGPWLVEVWPLTAVAACTALVARVDLIFLSRFRPMAEAGWYGAASRLFDLVQVLPALLMGVLFPILSRLAVGDDAARRDRAYERLFRWLAALAVPAAILLHVWAGVIVGICYGPAFADSAGVLRLLAPAMGFSFLGYLFVNALIASDRQKAFLGVTLAGSSVSVVANLMLVPSWGPAGAAWARVLTEAVLLAGGLVVFRRFVHAVPVSLLARIVLAAAVSLTAAWAAGGSLAGGTLAALLYVPVLWALGAIGSDDFAFGLRLLRSRR